MNPETLIHISFFIVLFLLGCALIARQQHLAQMKRPANPTLRAFTIRSLFISRR